jgi:hypothetical protein
MSILHLIAFFLSLSTRLTKIYCRGQYKSRLNGLPKINNSSRCLEAFSNIETRSDVSPFNFTMNRQFFHNQKVYLLTCLPAYLPICVSNRL